MLLKVHVGRRRWFMDCQPWSREIRKIRSPGRFVPYMLSVLHVDYARACLTEHNRLLPRCATHFARSWDRSSIQETRNLPVVHCCFSRVPAVLYPTMRLMNFQSAFSFDGWKKEEFERRLSDTRYQWPETVLWLIGKEGILLGSWYFRLRDFPRWGF